MKSDTALRALFICVALLGLQVVAHAQSTTWTGAVSTDWNNSANWSAGLPDATKDATIGPATRACVLSTGTSPACRNLTVSTGGSLTLSNTLSLAGNLDIGATVAGLGTLRMYTPSGQSASTRSLVCRNASTVPNVSVGDVLATDLAITDTTVRGDFQATNLPVPLRLFGSNDFRGQFLAYTQGGGATGSVQAGGSSALTIGTINTRWPISVPTNFRFTSAVLGSTSSITPAAGVIVFPSGTTSTVSFFDGGSLGDIRIMEGATLTVLDPQYSNTPLQGIGNIDCRGTMVFDMVEGALSLGTMDITGTVRFTQSQFTVGGLVRQCNGTITVRSGGLLEIDDDPVLFRTSGLLHVTAGASMRLNGSAQFAGLLCEGSLFVEDGCTSLDITNSTISGILRFLGPNQSTSPNWNLRGSTLVQQGGLLVIDPFTYPLLRIEGDPQVNGTLDCRGGGHVACAGILNVGSTGKLHLSAVTAVLPELTASAVSLQGELYAADCTMRFAGPGGLRLLPGSHLTSLIRTSLTSTSTDPNAVLLDVSRTGPTLLSSLTFGSTSGSNPPKGVRASSPYPVQISSSGGPRAGAAFEDDPLGVISWSNGVTYAGAATPGCLGLAECETTGDARLGNASFAFRCRRAHPSGAAIFLLGLSTVTVPTPFAGLNLWFDPALPLSSVFRTADATGTVVSPQPLPANPAFAGLTFTGQFVLFEPPGCTPSNLSASTAVRIVLQP